MKKYIVLSIVALLTITIASAQKTNNPKTQQLVDVSIGFGKGQVSAVAGYFYNWNLGSSKRFFIGIGVRVSSIFGSGGLYTSAPASLAGDIGKTDTLYTINPVMVATNLVINLGYNITPKLQAGFNIDAIGFTVGKKNNPNPIAYPKGYLLGSAKPTGFNVLLVGNNDKGSLNSEFYARYKITEKFGVKLAYQYLFNELTTTTKVQTTPESNDRFRSKVSLVNIGFSYHF
jgi:hypothetical protein